MLWVYTDLSDSKEFLQRYPDALQWQDCTISDLVRQAETVLDHHSNAAIALGYIEGWMLSIPDEIRLRRLLRTYPVSIVCSYPMALPLAWKNELELLHVNPQQHGDANSHHDGRPGSNAVHDEHGHSVASPSNPVPSTKGRKARGVAPRRKRTGQD